MNNEKLLKQLENQENTAKENAESILENTNSKIFKSLFEFWQNLNRELAVEKMFLEFKKANPSIKIKVEMDFYFNGNSKRPNAIDVDVYVDGQHNNSLSKEGITNP